jgi:hypothetical protein
LDDMVKANRREWKVEMDKRLLSSRFSLCVFQIY